ncbi:DUF7475 family protein [Halomicrococcus sp. NG-SE-24]|uniref:DUF7475 family protein n=1 Tax=Halomicrococcus sp. NG-SE-24 TaxID=3436928 RepID=UPI003D95EF5F
MSRSSTETHDAQSLISLPSNRIGYIAILAAVVTAGIHLFLAPTVMEFDQLTGILFYLNGLGFIGGVILFVSRYWRRELYLIAVGYALATIIAFFVMDGPINPLSITAKVAEAIVAFTGTYLYLYKKTT